MPIWESCEWTNVWWSRPEMNQRILLSGDSITNGYFSFVENAFKDEYSAGKYVTSKAVDNIYLARGMEMEIHEYGRDTIKLIHMNSGIHGAWRFTREQYRIAYDSYVQSLMEMAPNAKLLLALSTPLRIEPADVYTYEKHNDKILMLNEVVCEIGQKYNLTVNDLYSVVDKKSEYASGDGVHFNKDGYEALGNHTAQLIRKELAK